MVEHSTSMVRLTTYVEGRNIAIERRYSEGKTERLPDVEALPQCLVMGVRREDPEKPYPRDLRRLLCFRRERRGEEADDQDDRENEP